MRNVPISDAEHLDREVLAIGTDYPPDHLLNRHRHRRAQLLYGATGVMRVETDDGTWTVPTRRAVLIPPGTSHQVRMAGVSTRSLYLEPEVVSWFPQRCQVVEVSPLLRELLLAAVDIEPLYARRGRDGVLVELILHELRAMTPVPFELPLPREPRLRARCASFQRRPSIHESSGEWAAALHVSERTLNRMFRAETGLTFQRWRQRACTLHAIRRLGEGAAVTTVAAELGYENPTAFTAMFGRETGASPSRFRSAG